MLIITEQHHLALICINMSSNITPVMDFKGYRVDIKHCWVDGTPTKVYFIENMPFTFETLNNSQKEDQWILYECSLNPEFTFEQMNKNSEYLHAEQMHPMYFDVPTITVETMPDERL